jgi:predicted metalloprotease
MNGVRSRRVGGALASRLGQLGDAAEGAHVKRWWTSLLPLVLLPAQLVACAQEADRTVLTGGPPSSTGPEVADDPGLIAEQAIDDVDAFWKSTFPEVYGDEFDELDGFYPYGPDTEMPPCGNPPPTYEMIAQNAFYCPGDDLIAWDEATLIPELNEAFGSFTVAMVFAHEFGHAVQARAGAIDRTVDLELQADCFAGAWTAYVADGDAAHFGPDDIDLDQAVAGIIAIRDAPGTSADDPLAHGSGFDRVSAFQDGYENKAAACVEYTDPRSDRATVEIEFVGRDEFESGGNLHLEDRGPDDLGLLSLAELDLNEFYEQLFGELGASWAPVEDLVLVDPGSDELLCGGDRLTGDDLEYAAVYCGDENVVALDGEGLVPLLEGTGDFAVAAEIARLWAQAAQTQLGIADDDQASLQADCLTGVWAFSSFPRADFEPDNLQMSAGDLDEGIMGFLKTRNEDEATGDVFARAAALRTGFFEGYQGCEEYGPLS